MAPRSGSPSFITSYALLAAGILFLHTGAVTAGSIPEQRKQELINMVRQDCGSCHGITLKGGLGPPLTSRILTGKPHGLLVNTIMYGRKDTPMPPWQALLSREEIEWIVGRLKDGSLDSWKQPDD